MTSAKDSARRTTPPPEPVQKVNVTDPFQEFVGSTGIAPFIPGQRALPESIDDAERDFGTDIYDKMSHDSTVGGTTEILKMLVLEDGFTVCPRHTEPDDREPTAEEKADIEASKEVADFVRWSVDRLARTDRDFTVVLYDLLEAMSHGHKLAEVTVELMKTGQYKGRTALKSVRPKPRRSYRLVTNEFNELLGVIAVVPGVSPVLRQGLAPNVMTMPNAVSRAKLLVFSFRVQDGDPSGTSFYRAAYDPWRQKQITKPSEVKFMNQFAGGKQSATLGENLSGKSFDLKKSDGTTEKVSASEYVLGILKEFSGGGAAVFPFGTTFSDHVPNAEGKAFESFYDRKDRDIVTALLGSARTLQPTKRNSQADAGAAENILDTVKNSIRGLLCDVIENQLFRLLVALNYGDDAAERLLPRAVMSQATNPDFAANLAAICAGVESGAITEEMLPTVLMQKCGLRYIPSKVATLLERRKGTAKAEPEDGAPKKDKKEDDEPRKDED